MKNKPTTPTSDRLTEVTKKIGGANYPASSFLVVEDPESPSTWHLPVKSPTGTPDHRLMGAAWAALHGGYRGQKYAGPGKTQAISKLRRLYQDEDMETPSGEASNPETLDDLDSLMTETLTEVGRRIQKKQLEALQNAATALATFLKWAEYTDEDEPDEDGDGEGKPKKEGMTPVGSQTSEVFQSFMRAMGHDAWEHWWPVDLLLNHPTLGNALVAKEQEKQLYYAVGFVGGDGEAYTFQPIQEWKTVVLTYVEVAAPTPTPPTVPEPPEMEAETDPPTTPATESAGTPDPGTNQAQPTAETDGNPTAPASPTETTPETTPEPEALTEGQLSESFAGVVLEEQEGAEVPLSMDVVLIQPGFGNQRDNNYYPAEMLKRDAKVFAGAKMYESDHRDAEKSTRTWVSTVKAIKGFTDDGAPIGHVVVHDQNFAERVKALKTAGLLEKMECSILAVGKSKKGAVDGKNTNVVEEITQAISVDWVTRAGAGGRAIGLAETNQTPESETTPPEVLNEDSTPTAVYLTEAEVKEILDGRPGLPVPVKNRIAKAGPFETAERLAEFINEEVEYLKKVTGAGDPFAQTNPVTENGGAHRMTNEEYEQALDAVVQKYK